MKRLDLRRHPPGWLALAAMATAMAVYTWPQRLNSEVVWQGLQQAWRSTTTSVHDTTPHGQPAHQRRDAIAGGFDPFSRATGTALPVLATVTAMTPAPPGPSQIVRCHVNGQRIYADNWTACPRGVGELISLSR
jgi:hypothetical protein